MRDSPSSLRKSANIPRFVSPQPERAGTEAVWRARRSGVFSTNILIKTIHSLVLEQHHLIHHNMRGREKKKKEGALLGVGQTQFW